MSRTGAKAVTVPDGVNAAINGQLVSVKGPKGELSVVLVDDVEVQMSDGLITVIPRGESKRARSMWGLSRTLVANLVDGVTGGFEKSLEIIGVGYRAQVQGKNLQLQLGLSHDVVYPIPEGIDVKCPSQTSIIVSGIEKQKVGQVAAEIRQFRPPEPYKGKGIRYVGEYVFRKEGKKK
ncbi:MAG TPA: 50S ribosomal protein L6 [Rhizobiales bacterium]|nr:50S ribosomal protein L6 [bacterium BMS3Bbin10]HDO51881.1 50S ribosomal protein L6 [Hyphomicrobiales bacterium]